MLLSLESAFCGRKRHSIHSVHFVTNDVNCPRIDNLADLSNGVLRVIWSEAIWTRLRFRGARSRSITPESNDARVPFTPFASSLVYIWTLSSAPMRFHILIPQVHLARCALRMQLVPSGRSLSSLLIQPFRFRIFVRAYYIMQPRSAAEPEVAERSALWQ